MRTTSALVALLCVLPAARGAAPAACSARSGAEAKPLVELYTSEGCSSCPPADRWLSRRYSSGEANFLAFHVDYWDHIGWPDRFASPTYSQRQRLRVRATGAATVYTPQVMVGEAVQVNWRNEGELRRALDAARTTAKASLTLTLHRSDTGWQAAIATEHTDKLRPDVQLWLARYVDAQSTKVRAGENRGATLRHDRVVRQLSGPWPIATAPRRIALPADAGSWGVTAFIQDARGAILQSLDLPAAACVARHAAP